MNLHLSGPQLATPKTADALYDTAAERVRQVAKWGVQTRPDGTSDSLFYRDNAAWAKEVTDLAAADGSLTWRHILNEEVLEAFAETDHAALREELIQVAAVALSWVEDIDRKHEAEEFLRAALESYRPQVFTVAADGEVTS